MFGKKNKAVAGTPALEAFVSSPARTAGPGPGRGPGSAKPGSVGKQAYEARRAEKAGLPLDKWMAQKEQRAEAERKVGQAAAEQARRDAVPGRPGLLRRLIDRAHRPI